MKANVIVFLIRSSFEDIKDLNVCLQSLIDHLSITLNDSDVVIFHEPGFEDYKEKIIFTTENFPSKITYVEITLPLPPSVFEKYPKKILDFYPHPTDSTSTGFSIGYRSMCRFFSGELFRSDIFLNNGYKYVMRLDSDSKFLSGSKISLFEWATQNNLIYSYIQSAIQWDHPLVCRKFKSSALWILLHINLRFFLRGLVVPVARMYYTNFEIMEVAFFRSNNWEKFWSKLDDKGGFYLYRWGDAIVRYMGIVSMVPKSRRKKIPPGFIYQHGGIFNSAENFSRRTYILRNVNRLG